MILGVAAFACLALIFTLLLFLVYQLRPKTFKVKAAITKWISVEVELESPQPTSPSALPNRQQEMAATTSPADTQERPTSAP
jgi:hypothetical protein